MKDNLTRVTIGVLQKDGMVEELRNLKWKKIRHAGYVSQKLNNGDFEYFLVLEVLDLREACDERGYVVSIHAVSEQKLGEDEVNRLLSDYDQTEIIDEQTKAAMLAIEGYSAVLFCEKVFNKRKAVKLGKEQAEAIHVLFGFYMDQPLNLVGSTGWDFIRGDIMGGLSRQTSQERRKHAE